MNVEDTTLRCPSCGQANRPGRRFCAQCGTRFGAEREVALKGFTATQHVIPVEWAEPTGARR